MKKSEFYKVLSTICIVLAILFGLWFITKTSVLMALVIWLAVPFVGIALIIWAIKRKK